MGDAPANRALHAVASAVWPAAWVPANDFASYVKERTGAEAPPGDDALVALYLACACLRGVGPALAAFEETYLPDIRRACARTGLLPDQVTELAQVLREELLVGRNGAPTLGEYRGRGELRGWLRVTATRAAVRAKKRDAKAAGVALDQLEARATGDDPELSYMKALYRSAFRKAFQIATEGLDAEERTLLHEHTVLGKSIDELGAARGVHRATAARWVQAAREKLFAATRREFGRQVNVSPRELASVFRLVQSRLDVTMKRLLA
jgi:RNA polymerase sigma-70 factor (ECF subfamily)